MKKIVIIVFVVTILAGVFFGIKYLTKETDVNSWNEERGVNKPDILTGMTPVYFPEASEVVMDVNDQMLKNHEWYSYEEKKWANSRTEDGSLWVWIPRYSYKITYLDEEDRSQGATIDIMFLKGTTNKNKDDIDVTTLGYIVHPAFEDGRQNEFKNGEWNKKLTGMWIAKFQAGFAEQARTSSQNISSIETDIEYKTNVHEREKLEIEKGTKLSYPVFIGKTYAYNWLQVTEMYELSRALTNKDNPYGLDNKTAETYMMKNSTWGAVSYLSHSKYGTDGEKISINNVSVSEVHDRATGVTGYGSLEDEPNYIIEELAELGAELPGGTYAWYTEIGQTASTTKNRYGIFDMRGALSEYVVAFSEDLITEYDLFNSESRSSHLSTVYRSYENGTMSQNYKENRDVYGDAIFETSKDGIGYTSWHGQTSFNVDFRNSFFVRGGEYKRGEFSGIFSFTGHDGHPDEDDGFRAVIVRK